MPHLFYFRPYYDIPLPLGGGGQRRGPRGAGCEGPSGHAVPSCGAGHPLLWRQQETHPPHQQDWSVLVGGLEYSGTPLKGHP